MFSDIVFWNLLGPWIVKHAVYDLMLKFLQFMYTVRKVERFRLHLEGGIDFENNEVFDLFIKLVKPNFEKVKLDVNEE